MGAWDVVADVLGFGGPDGNDHGSSNWAAWGHPEIRSMLDNTVDPATIYEAADAWRDQGRNTQQVLAGFTRDLNAIVATGWRGTSADAALTALGPIDQWAASHADTADRITRLMEESGSAAAEAKASVPPPKSHSWIKTLAVTAVTGPAGGIADAVMQERAQCDAHAEAVRIMTNVYSAPINDHRAVVPTYPQLNDPSMRPPEPVPDIGAAPSTLSSIPGVSGAGSGGIGGPHRADPPAAVTLQGLASDGATSLGAQHGSHPVPDPAIQRQPQPGANGTAVAAAAGIGAPIAAPIAAAAVRRARAGGGRATFRTGPGASETPARGPAIGEGGLSAMERAGLSHPSGFRTHPSSAPADLAEGRVGGLARGAGATAAGRAGMGELIPPIGAAGGKRGEDSEHRRPSYLVEMDDVFADGTKVAPAVIGDDSPGQGGSS